MNTVYDGYKTVRFARINDVGRNPYVDNYYMLLVEDSHGAHFLVHLWRLDASVTYNGKTYPNDGSLARLEAVWRYEKNIEALEDL